MTVNKTSASKKTASKKTPTKKANNDTVKPKTTSKKTTKAKTTKPNTGKQATTSSIKSKGKQTTMTTTTSSSTSPKIATKKISATGAVEFAPYTVKKGEEYMSDAMREHFRQILLQWKLDLAEEVERTVSLMKDEAANFPDPTDRATQEEEFGLELRARDRGRKLGRKIEKALIDIDGDDYGYCEQCGVEIGVRRLEARPTAKLCIDCKTLQEIKEKQMAD